MTDFNKETKKDFDHQIDLVNIAKDELAKGNIPQAQYDGIVAEAERFIKGLKLEGALDPSRTTLSTSEIAQDVYDMYNNYYLAQIESTFGNTLGYETIQTPADSPEYQSATSAATASIGGGEAIAKDVSNKIFEVEIPGRGTVEYTGAEIEAMIKAEAQPNLSAIQTYYGNDEQGSEAYGTAIEAWRNQTTVNLIEVTDTQTGETLLADADAVDFGDRYEPVTEAVADATVPAVEDVTDGTADPSAAVEGEIVEDTSAADLAASKEQAIADLQFAFDNGVIGYDEFVLYSDVVNAWEAGAEVDFGPILETFDDLKANTIDPYYAQQIEIATAQVTAAQEYMAAQRELQLDSENINAQERVRSAKASFESAGLTFTGEAARQLGAESAFATDAENPLLQLQSLGEGLIPETSSLIASSSLAEYEESLRSLGEQAELVIGTEATTGLGLGTLGTSEAIVGSIAEAQDLLEKQTLSSLFTQSVTNESQGQFINLLS
tara:strand:+ start:210 stop:1688 length:1479 start_codon:yes stop_codon:yes gene_type:complete